MPVNSVTIDSTIYTWIVNSNVMRYSYWKPLAVSRVLFFTGHRNQAFTRVKLEDQFSMDKFEWKELSRVCVIVGAI